MALKKEITLKSNFGDDVVFSEAYIRVETLSGNKNHLRFDVSILKKANEQIIDKKHYTFVPDMQGDNFIRQAYKHLKTLPEFAGAEDC